MWKMLSRISEYKGQGSRVKGKNLLVTRYSLLVTFLLFTVSCAPKHVELPSYEEIPIENAISELKNIQSIEAVLSVEYEKDDSAMSGDVSLNLSEDGLNLRLYYLGFLVGEIKEENGIVKSVPKIDKNKSMMLIDGLKNSFFWWNMEDYTVQEKEDIYELKNSYRKILVNKKTLLPLHQTIELNDGEELNIFYDAPAKTAEDKKISSWEDEKKENENLSISQPLNLSTSALWYNSRLKIEFKNHVIKIKVTSYSVER